jgi:hypothetical protein
MWEAVGDRLVLQPARSDRNAGASDGLRPRVFEWVAKGQTPAGQSGGGQVVPELGGMAEDVDSHDGEVVGEGVLCCPDDHGLGSAGPAACGNALSASASAAGGPASQRRRAHESSAAPALRTVRTHLPGLRLALKAEPSHHVEPVLGRPSALRVPPPATRDLHLMHLLPGRVTPQVVPRLSPILGREAPPPARGLNLNRGPATPHGSLDVGLSGAPTGGAGARSAESDSTLPILAHGRRSDTRWRSGTPRGTRRDRASPWPPAPALPRSVTGPHLWSARRRLPCRREAQATSSGARGWTGRSPCASVEGLQLHVIVQRHSAPAGSWSQGRRSCGFEPGPSVRDLVLHPGSPRMHGAPRGVADTKCRATVCDAVDAVEGAPPDGSMPGDLAPEAPRGEARLLAEGSSERGCVPVSDRPSDVVDRCVAGFGGTLGGFDALASDLGLDRRGELGAEVSHECSFADPDGGGDVADAGVGPESVVDVVLGSVDELVCGAGGRGRR